MICVLGWIMVLERHSCPIAKLVNTIILHSKENFADVIKVKILDGVIILDH